MGDKTRGLFGKFIVRRADGNDNAPVIGGDPAIDRPVGKHYGCDYFVLDLTHDPHAWPALQAYADRARHTATFGPRTGMRSRCY